MRFKSILIILLMLFGCVSSSSTARVMCIEDSFSAAYAMSREGYQVRIACDSDHCQAQAFIDGVWRWLHVSRGMAWVSKQDSAISKPYRIYNLPEDFEEWAADAARWMKAEIKLFKRKKIK